MARNACRLILVVCAVIFSVGLAGQLGQLGQKPLKPVAKIDKKTLMAGLAEQLNRLPRPGLPTKDAQMDSKGKGDCDADCIAAAKTVAEGAWMRQAGDPALAAIEGAVQSACKSPTGAGELTKKSVLDSVKKAKGHDVPIVHGTAKIPLGGKPVTDQLKPAPMPGKPGDQLKPAPMPGKPVPVPSKPGGDTSCSVTYTVTFDRDASTVTALFSCDTGGVCCSFAISYPANEQGRPVGPAKLTKL